MLNTKQIPSDLGNYLAGFTDGEGSFYVTFRKREDYKIPWKISLCFNVSQKDPVILSLFKKHLQCGSLRKRKHDGVWYYEVTNFDAIRMNVIPFFNRFGFLSAKKKKDFSKFKKIAKLIETNDHLTIEGIQEILKLRKEMNDGDSFSSANNEFILKSKRKYSEKEILRILRDYMPNA